MTVSITRTTSGDTDLIIASDQLTGNDFAAISVNAVVDYTSTIKRVADSLELLNQQLTGIDAKLASIDYHIQNIGGGAFGDVAMYKLFIEQGGILDNANDVDGEKVVQAIAQLKAYQEKIMKLNE